MTTLSVFYHPFLCVFLKIILFCDYVTLEAQPKNDVALPGWFNSVETYVISSINNNTEPTTVNIGKEMHDVKTRKKAARKNRRRIVKKVTNRFRNGVPLEVIHEIEEVKNKRKKRKRKNKRKFAKTETDKNVDSNVSHDGKDKIPKSPVDIIVHIKMAE